jgi:hypothetical protein
MTPTAITDFAKIESPILMFKDDFPESVQKQIAEALESDDVQFVRGHSMNRFTTLIYQGDTILLNLMLEKFSKCPGFTIHVSFKNASQGGHYLNGNDFSIHQTGNEPKIQVIINSASERVDLENLYLPDIRGSK